MAFFALLWKARTIEKYRLNYEREKINSIVMGNTQIEETLVQKWRHYRYNTQERISRTFKQWYPEGSGVSNFLLYLRTDQTFLNFLFKSLMGFIGGIILTYLCFMFFVFQLSISLIHATIMSSTIGVLLTLGLAFSYRIRCLVFLLIPQLFSRVGRYTLTCYALVLILTGPATNTLKNSEVLSESMACSQEQIKVSVHHLNESLKTPFHAIKDSIKLMMERLQMITRGVKEAVVKINRLILSIVSAIHSSFGWLKSVAELCNTKLGTPYERCTNALKSGVADCRDILGPDYKWLCGVAYVGCIGVKPYNSFCQVADFMDEAIVATIKKKLKNFSSHIRAMFHVELHIQYSHSFTSNGSRSAGQVAAGIVTEIRNKADPLLTWLSWSSCVTSLFLVLIIFRAKYYQHMYETRSRFDNRYITRDLQELDLKRQRQGRETVLPLNRRERAKYITTTSFRLVASEKVNMNRSVVFMSITTFKLLIHMIADYSLYWVLMTIRYHGRFQSYLMPGVPKTGAHITGNGFIAKLFRSVVGTLDIPLAYPSPSPVPCLPNPYPPDLRRYAQIGVLIFMLWFFALFEPYGLRLRHIVLGQYRPERAKARASWLYNHILRTRAGFMKFARRKLHREYKYSSETHLTFRQWMNDHIPFQYLKCILRICPPEPHCLLCGLQYNQNDPDTRLTRCATPKCPGVYCSSCFSDIGHLCTICLSPVDYGDLSDVSLERGSSDESSDSELESENVMRPPEDNKPLWSKIIETGNAEESQEKETMTKSNKRSHFKEIKAHASRILRRINENTLLQKPVNYRILPEQTLNKNNYDILHIFLKEVKKSKGNIIVGINIRMYDKVKEFITIVRYFMTMDEGLDVTKNKGDNETNKTTKNQKEKKSSNKGDTKNQKASKDKISNNKPKKIKRQKSSARLKPKYSREKLGEFHSFFSKHWRNIKFSLIPCVNMQVRKNELPKERKNHKRRKKRKSYTDIKESETTISKVKKEIKSTRNYRISAFLADLEWTKRDYNKRNNNKEGSVFQNTDCLSKSNNHKPNTIVTVAQVKNPPAQWYIKTSKSTCCQCFDKVCTCSKPESSLKVSTPVSKQAKFAQKALKRFRNKVKLLCSSSNILNSKVDKANAASGGSFMENEAQSEHLMRRMNYYHTLLGDNVDPENRGMDRDQNPNVFARNEILLRGLKSATNIKQDTPVKNNQTVAHSKSDMLSFQRNKSTYVFKKKNTTFTQDTKRTTDVAQVTNELKDCQEKSDDVKPAKNTPSFVRNFYSSIFGSSHKPHTESFDGANEFKDTAEKSIVAEPEMTVASCQYARTYFRDISTQFETSEERLPAPEAPATKNECETAAGADKNICSCATQHILTNKNMGTMLCRHHLCRRIHDAAVQYQRKIFTNKVEETKEENSIETTESCSTSSETSSTTRSDATKTDTTVCSLATVDYNEPINRNKRYRVKVITKANQSTITDKARCHDMSTYTEDWWSPILEKKNNVITNNVTKLYKEYIIADKFRKQGRCRRKSRGVETDGKFVSFKSRTQIIPQGMDDILSPSRYLLESQKYYNELFYKCSSPQVYPVSLGQSNQDKDKTRSPVASRRSHHHKTKRLDECYSPKRQMSPRKRHGDSLKRCDSPRWRQPRNLPRHKHK